MMTKLFYLNTLPKYVRWPVKCILVGVILIAVCFPHPARLVRHVERWRNPNALIEPEAPSLEPLVEELRPLLGPDIAPAEALKTVEKFVYDKIKYQWDWENWLNADYLPTVAEAVEKGSEDCDGRAVVAASLLRRFGFEAQIVTDFSHVWVKTEHGETMGPGKRKAIVADEQGLRIDSNALSQLPRALAYGLAPFPFLRELIVLSVCWLLVLRRGVGVGRSLLALALLVDGLLLLRAGGANYRNPEVWLQLAGLANLAGGVLLLLIRGPRERRLRRPAVDGSSKVG